MEEHNYYKILLLDPYTSHEAIKATINKRLRKLQSAVNNPDKSIRQKAKEQMETLLKARKILLDPEKKSEYDKKIEKNRIPGFKKKSSKHRHMVTMNEGLVNSNPQ